MENCQSNEVTITKVSGKKSEDVKSFAESTMSELLGWYGYQTPRQDPMKQPKTCKSLSESNESEDESVKFTEGCGWCGKTVDENNSVISATAIFCSELCFSQSRRASFKKNKTCDWCRHARQTVSYVDFQDNAAQLQFCSDKCLNQYKMHIFCRETQAHLELHPHPHLTGNDSTGGSLITPDLWLKSCTSLKANVPFPSLSPKTNEATSQCIPKVELVLLPQPPLPLSVSPSNKLLATDTKRNRPRPSRRFKRGCSSTVTSLCSSTDLTDIPQDLRIRQTPPAEVPKKTKTESDRMTSFDENSDCEKHIIKEPFDVSSRANITPSNFRAILGNILPPPTTFVPYPVILPLPIPIPIPVPIPKMFKTNNNKELIELKDVDTQTDIISDSLNNNDVEGKHTEAVQKETTEAVETTETETSNRRLLRKRKQIDTNPKVFLKHKKTLSTFL